MWSAMIMPGCAAPSRRSYPKRSGNGVMCIFFAIHSITCRAKPMMTVYKSYVGSMIGVTHKKHGGTGPLG